jgi:hypothetical protein
MDSWKVKRGNQEWTLAGPDELRAHAASGQLLPDDYVYNPILERWMYARELAETEAIFSTARSSVEADRLNQASFGIGCLGLLLMLASPLIGGVVLLIAVVLSVVYYLKKPSGLATATGRTAGCVAAGAVGIVVLAAVVIITVSRLDKPVATKSTDGLPTPFPTASQSELNTNRIESEARPSPTLVVIEPVVIEPPVKPAAVFRTVDEESPIVVALVDRSTREYHLLGCPSITRAMAQMPRSAAVKDGYVLAADCRDRRPRGVTIQRQELTPESARALAEYERQMVKFRRGN